MTIDESAHAPTAVAAKRFFLSLRFGLPSPNYRYQLEGPIHFGPFLTEEEAKQALKDIITEVRTLKTFKIRGIPRFSGGRYVVRTERSERLTVIEPRRGIAPLDSRQTTDLKRRMKIIIPVMSGAWKQHLEKIPRYLMERVVREYNHRFGPGR
jgi:hypothetical protein